MRIVKFIYRYKINGLKHGDKIIYIHNLIKRKTTWINNKKHGDEMIYSHRFHPYVKNSSDASNLYAYIDTKTTFLNDERYRVIEYHDTLNPSDPQFIKTIYSIINDKIHGKVIGYTIHV